MMHPSRSYVMAMGVLQSLLQFGDWRGDPQDIAEQGDAVAAA